MNLRVLKERFGQILFTLRLFSRTKRYRLWECILIMGYSWNKYLLNFYQQRSWTHYKQFRDQLFSNRNWRRHKEDYYYCLKKQPGVETIKKHITPNNTIPWTPKDIKKEYTNGAVCRAWQSAKMHSFRNCVRNSESVPNQRKALDKIDASFDGEIPNKCSFEHTIIKNNKMKNYRFWCFIE
jgi:hypothetical protein